MNYFLVNHIGTPFTTLSESESHHCTRVLRLTEGDKVGILDGHGNIGVGSIHAATKKQVVVSIQSTQTFVRDCPNLTLVIAPTKSNDRVEWLLEKGTEFGVSEFSFITTYHSERKQIKLSRYQKVIEAAVKQSGNPFLPTLTDLQSFEQFIQVEAKTERYIATLHPTEDKFNSFRSSANDCVVMIGPEGGFSQQEVELAMQHQFQPISLGKQRLRTETAGMFVASVNYAKSLYAK